MPFKNSHIHFLIETNSKNKIKCLADEEALTISEYCRKKLLEESRIIKLGRMIEQLLMSNPKFDLNFLAFEKLKECPAKNNIIYFKTIWSKLCRNFSITKDDCLELLRNFEREGKIKFVQYRGVKIVK